MAQFPSPFGGSLDAWIISLDERAKHDQQFHSLAPTAAGFITGDQARSFFLQSGLPPPILAQIWALADLNSDGKMDAQEFSIAMKLIKLKLQGHPLPPSLPPAMKQLPPVPPFGLAAVSGLPGLPPGPLPPLAGMGVSPPLLPPVAPPPGPPMANGAPPMIPPLAGFPQSAGALNKNSSFTRSGGSLQKGQSFEAPSSAAAQPPPDWAVPQSSRLKYRQLFNSHDKMMCGHLTGPQARTILMQSSLPQSQLASIWNLSDIDQDGKLTAEEFILAMHLIDMAMSGLPLPQVLPPDFIPPTFRRVRSGSGVSVATVSPADQWVPEEPEEEDPQSAEKKLPVTFEDKKRENFERGNLELEKRRQALQEQQRKEQERLAALERQEQQRREQERLQQERRRQQELEKQLEKQREVERQREEERRKEIERREAAKREMERQRQLEWERSRRQELLTQRSREQEHMVQLKARQKTLEFELEALGDKKQQLEGKLQDVRFRLSAQRQEVESTMKTRELRIAEITQLQKELQETQQWLGRLIPEKQGLNEQLKQVQQESLHSDSLATLRKSLEVKESTRQQLRDQLDEVERETRSKLLEIDAFNSQLKELKEIHNRQQRQKQKEAESGEELQKEVDSGAEIPEKGVLDSQEARPSPVQDGASSVWGGQKASVDPPAQPAQPWAMAPASAEDEGGTNDVQEKFSNLFTSQPDPGMPATQALWPMGEKVPVAGFSQDRVKVVYYKALYPFHARSHDEITIQPGDVIMVDESQTGEPGWLGGELRGNTGWFPANYAEQIPEAEIPSGLRTAPSAGPLPKPDAPATPTPAASTPTPAAATPSPAPPTGTAPSPAPPTPATTTAPSSASGNWADFSTTWPSSGVAVEKQESDGWDAWPTQPSLSVPSAGQLRQRSAFTPATLSGSSPSPVLGQGEKVEGLQAQALYPWRAKKDNHLTFNKSDIITVLEQQDMWWFGEVQGERGWFPKSYVKLVSGPVRSSLSIESGSSGSPPSMKRPSPSPSKPLEPGEEFIAMYTYESREPGDLTFQQGDVIAVQKKEGDWWTGCAGGRTGVFPSNYVKPRDSEGLGAAGKTGSLGKKPEVAQVMAPYTATGAEQLTLAPGQLILIRKKSAGGWWEGELQARGKRRQIGWFPANYVKLLSPSSSKTTPTEPVPPKLPPSSSVCQVIGMYDYIAQNDDELPFAKGQIINVLSKEDPDWWKGELNGTVGLFPSNYVKPAAGADLSQQ